MSLENWKEIFLLEKWERGVSLVGGCGGLGRGVRLVLVSFVVVDSF